MDSSMPSSQPEITDSDMCSFHASTSVSTKHHEFASNEASSLGPKRRTDLIFMKRFWVMPNRPNIGGGAVVPGMLVRLHILSRGK